MKLILGDCLEKMKELKDCSVDSLVTDPPAGISFMGKDWDHDKGGRDEWIKWMSEVMREALRVLKPGAHGLVWSIPRTAHWTGFALENAGFEVRDCVTHLFGSGFPKSHSLSKAFNKAAGAEREVIGSRKADDIRGGALNHRACDGDTKTHMIDITASSTPLAKQWDGWGTALKPAAEFWWLVRRPLSESTIAKNVERWGCGGLNIDGSRISISNSDRENLVSKASKHFSGVKPFAGNDSKGSALLPHLQGRFPANLLLSCACEDEEHEPECAVRMLDEQSPFNKETRNKSPKGTTVNGNETTHGAMNRIESVNHAGQGHASRFFKVFREVEEHAIESECNNINAPIAEPNSKIILETEKTKQTHFVLENVWHFLDSVNHFLIVKCAEKYVKSIDANFVLDIAKMLNKKDLHLLPCQDYILDSKNSILIHNLALLAEQSESTDIIETIQSLLKLCGSALIVIEKSINLESLGKKANTACAPTRFLYNPKISTSERNAGLPEGVKSNHPTVKPKRLMSYLIKLITPPNGIVLDPFMGSGSTGIAAKECGFDFIGIEKEIEYFEIAKARIG